jgi:hypothetical protein
MFRQIEPALAHSELFFEFQSVRNGLFAWGGVENKN